mmetsp:Transcript_62848/g.138320  ORF Transcript_62848/g.138320 Transcript_62848/m.138320 type:complete len:175 (-) Transcript_62848:119-643(-)
MEGQLLRPEPRNETIKRLVCIQCRCVGNQADETLQRDLQYAETLAKKRVDPAIVELIKEITEKCMTSVELERYADRKNPVVFIYNLATWPSAKAKQVRKEARFMLDSQLQPLVGDRSQAIWKVCFHGAWCEQNTRDWDGAQGGTLTGAAWGYKASMEEDRKIVDEFSQKMGFDD